MRSFTVVLLALFSVYIVALAGATTGNTPSNNAISSNAPLTFNSFLRTYISNSIINESTFVNITENGQNYSIMVINAATNNFTVINRTNGFSFVLNQSGAFSVLSPYLINKYYPSTSELSSLSHFMKEFQNSANGDYSDCLLETGLTNFMCNYTNSNENTCLSNTCSHSPICVLDTQSKYAFVDPNEMYNATLNFSVHYTILNDSFNGYYSTLSSMQPSNIGTSITTLSELNSNITSLSASIIHNPLWYPPPTNITPTQETQICASYPFDTGPWYCLVTIGLCQTPSYNSTALNDGSAILSQLNSLPLSNTTKERISLNAALNAQGFYYPEVNATEKAQFNTFINSTTVSYNSLVLNVTFLNSRFQNESLALAFQNLVSTYNSIIDAGYHQNITLANKILGDEILNVSKLYSKVSKAYVPVYALAQNNTALILVNELNHGQEGVPYPLISLAILQQNINQQLETQVNATTLNGIKTSMLKINSEVKGISVPFSFAALTKSFYYPMVSALLAGSGSPVQKMASAPYYTLPFVFIIGLAIIAIIYLGTYHRLRKKNKLRLSSNVKRAWLAVFMALFIIVVIIAIVTLFYANGANTFLPISGFLSQVAASNTVYMLVNGTVAHNSSVIACVNSTKSALALFGKHAYNMSLYGQTCTLSTNKSVTGTNCFDKVLSSGVPTIVITGTSGSMMYKGMYGNLLYVDSQSSNGASCMLSNIVRD